MVFWQKSGSQSLKNQIIHNFSENSKDITLIQNKMGGVMEKNSEDNTRKIDLSKAVEEIGVADWTIGEVKKFGLTQTKSLTYGGLIFMMLSFIIFLFLCYLLLPESTSKKPDLLKGWDIISHYFPQVLLLFSSLAASIIGSLLLRAAGTATKQPIPEQDHELLSDLLKNNNKEGIENYMKLNSLIGMSGFFTKIDFTGLPLATIVMTIVFCLLSLITEFYGGQTSSGFFDLAKLTLGAFIGSYVQKKVPGK